MVLQPLPQELADFAQGAMSYLDHYLDDETVRIVLNIHLTEEQKSLSVILDTGAPWCVFNPVEIERIRNNVAPILYTDGPLIIRGIAYPGWLYHVPIHLKADLGESMDVEAVAFVPDLPPDTLWPHPNFVGLDGFLNRIQFAVKPSENLFFFGPLT